MELRLQLNDTYFVLIKEELYEITWHLSNTVQLRSFFTIQVTELLLIKLEVDIFMRGLTM